ncbi:pentatricopeptide repeat-containing protein, partial [Tanacetum coccineum]
DHNVEEAIRLVNNLSNHGYRLDTLNLSSIIHALCDSNRFGEAHSCFQSCLSGSSAIGIIVPDEQTFRKDIVDLCLDQSARLLITALVFRVSQSFNAVVKEQLIAKLQETKEWLYEDGEDETKGVYVAKLNELKK